jgi:Uma2 family endonuclease
MKEDKISYEEFLAQCNEDTLAEWVDGRIITYSPAAFKHQEIVDFLIKLIGIYIEVYNLGKVVSAPFQMKLRTQHVSQIFCS